MKVIYVEWRKSQISEFFEHLRDTNRIQNTSKPNGMFYRRNKTKQKKNFKKYTPEHVHVSCHVHTTFPETMSSSIYFVI